MRSLSHLLMKPDQHSECARVIQITVTCVSPKKRKSKRCPNPLIRWTNPAFGAFSLVLLGGQRWATVAAMGAKRGKGKNPRDKDLTSRYLPGANEEERVHARERNSGTHASPQRRKMEQTVLAELRAGP